MAKAKTRAAKIRAKRGRPRMAPAAKEPNGRASRRVASVARNQEMTEAEARSVVVERRIRENNIIPFKRKDGKLITAERQAIDPRYGYVLGKLFMQGLISQEQHDAGVKYAQEMARYYGLSGIPFPSARAQDLFSIKGGGDDGESRIDAAKKARSAAFRLQDVVLLGMNHRTGKKAYDIGTGRKVDHVVKQVAIIDSNEMHLSPFMVGLLKKGLNALAKHYSGAG